MISRITDVKAAQRSRQRGFLLNPFRFATGAADPYWNNVILLCSFEGVNAGTSFTDLSKSPKTLTAAGNAQYSDEHSRFGSTSLKLDGAGDYVGIGSHETLQLGIGDFTLEAWVWLQPTGNGSDRNIFVQTSTGGISWGLIDAKLQLGANSVAYDLVTSNSVPDSGWVYVAANRSAGVISQSINGVMDGAASVARNYFATSNHYIGGQPAGQSINAYINQLRITKGVARDITKVPMARFPTK